MLNPPSPRCCLLEPVNCYPGPHVHWTVRTLAAIAPLAPPLAVAHHAGETVFFTLYFLTAPLLLWHWLAVIDAAAHASSCTRVVAFIVASNLTYAAVYLARPPAVAWALAALYAFIAVTHRYWIKPDFTRNPNSPPANPPPSRPSYVWLIVHSPRGTARHVVPLRLVADEDRKDVF